MTDEQFAVLLRVEHKLDLLLAAPAKDEEDAESLTLDGFENGRERDAGQPL